MNQDKQPEPQAQAGEQEAVAWPDAPETIYLQVCDASECDEAFCDHHEVTWCQDHINDTDIKYIRADTALQSHREALEAQRKALEFEAWEYRERIVPKLREALKACVDALKVSFQSHHYCEDSWYSCPKHEDGCANPGAGAECNCRADENNAVIDAAITQAQEAINV